jgi:hypothetical protein
LAGRTPKNCCDVTRGEIVGRDEELGSLTAFLVTELCGEMNVGVSKLTVMSPAGFA